MTTKSVVACVDDLFFRSKIDATARHLNLPVRFSDMAGLAGASGEQGTAAVLVELSSGGKPIDAIRALRAARATRDVPVIGFLSHVDKGLASEARDAGATRVLARSEFSETLPDLLMDLLAPGTKREVQEEPELPDE
jgi:CheY-like chemotaxis protein